MSEKQKRERSPAQQAVTKMMNERGKAHRFQKGQQQVEIAKKGGKASQEVQHKKKSLSELAIAVSGTKLTNPKLINTLKDMGIEDEDLTNNALVMAGVFKGAVAGDMKAVDKWQELTEATNDDDKLYELPARAIGKAFIDINRNILPNKDYIFDGGRGSLKSSYISLKIIELLKNNKTLHACIVRKVAGTLNDSVFNQIKWAINYLGLTDEFEYRNRPPEITYKKTGQKIYFRGCDDPVKLKSIKPEFGYIGILWIEERDQLNGAEEERSVKWSVLRGGMEAYFFASFNAPKSKTNWVNREKLEPNPNRIDHHSTYLDAPKEWLGQKFFDDAEHLREVNPVAYENELMGVPNGEGGNVFEYLEIRDITDEELASFDTIYQGVDWGWYPDQFAFIRLAYYPAQEKVFLLDELYVNKTPNSQTGQWILDKGYDDYYITCDSSEPKSVNDFVDMGLPARKALKGAGSVDYGFKWLQGRTIVIDPKRTPNAYNEYSAYEYARDKEGNVISGYPDANNHLLDASRYALEQFYNKRGTSA